MDNRKGRILHLDGDRKYSEKSYRFYKSSGLNFVVKNIPEYRQPYLVKDLVVLYKPDILVITGHDKMLKKNREYNNINNYKNSRFFIETVKRIRKYYSGKELAIFAGACQSYYEEIILAGANFASSPGRILIDFKDPLIVAREIANTQTEKFITIRDIESKLKDGRKGVSGPGSFGKMKRKEQL